MRDAEGNVIRLGDTIYSSYGVPPVYIEGRVIGVTYGGNSRWAVITPGHEPTVCLLSDFIRHMGGNDCVYIKKRRFEK